MRANELGLGSRPTSGTADEVVLAIDPINRFYRYPLAERLVPLVEKTSVTPNQITFVHALCGIAAGSFIASGSNHGFLAAFLLLETRAILDCLDGVLARRTGQISPYGPAIEAVGDGVSVVAVLIGSYVWFVNYAPGFPAGTMTVGTFVLLSFMALAYDSYRNRFSAALRGQRDGIRDAVITSLRELREGGMGVLPLIGFCTGCLQIAFFFPGQIHLLRSWMREADEPNAYVSLETEDSGDAHHGRSILEISGTFTRRAALFICGLVSGDNVLTIIAVGLLFGNLPLAYEVAMLYGVSVLLIAVPTVNAFFGRSSTTLADASQTSGKRTGGIMARLKELILVQKASEATLTRSVAIGLGSAFLPFPGVQTPFLLPICLLFRLNFPVVYSVNWINNPLTMGPIALLSYLTGLELIHLFDPSFTVPHLADFELEKLGWSILDLKFIGSLFLPLALGSIPYMLATPILVYLPTRALIRRIKRRGDGKGS